MELKEIIAQNIIELRKQNKLTQAELAEKLNYTDKAISKWERGESIPEISTLVKIAGIFGCTVDILLTENATKDIKKYAIPRNVIINRRIIAAACSLVVWIIAIIAFLYSYLYLNQNRIIFEIFFWALPINFLVLWILFKNWNKRKLTPYMLSGLLWSFLVAVYVTTYQYETWLIFIIGLPIQALIILLSCLKK